MSKRQKVNANSTSREVDYVGLCEDVVQRIEEVLKRGQMVYPRQNKDMAKRLSVVIAQFREAVEGCGSYKSAFVLLLAAMHRYCEKAEILVKECAHEDWCRALVFKFHSWNQGPDDSILDHINSVGKKILELAKRYSTDSTMKPDLFSLNVMEYIHVGDEDRDEMKERLLALTREGSNMSSKVFGFLLAQQVDPMELHLAQYLLKRYIVRGYNLQNIKSLMWEKEKEPIGTWGKSKFLGDGSGANGVWKTSWLGVPCAKKEFHGEASENIFLKEAFTMANMPRHPCIVDFLCCGNGDDKGERFIAMELMEKSLFDLIKERKGVHFSLDVALDIIWQIADGVMHLHHYNVAHRDLKPQNVVVKTLRSLHHEDYYCVKLVDFGSCKSEVEASEAQTMSYRGIGTTSYRAPEAHPDAHPQGLGKVKWHKADAYSFAMTCAHVLTLTTPFDDLVSRSELYTEILKGRRPVLSSGCPKKLVQLLNECWSTNPSKRPTFFKINQRLEKIIFDIMLVPFSSLKNSEIIKESTNVEMHGIREEEGGMKKEGHTSYFTAEDGSLCTEVDSERDSKSDVSKLPIVKLES